MNILKRLKLKMGLGTYSYSNTRMRAMKSKLMSESDYRKLKNMSIPEIVDKLQKEGYSKNIDTSSTDIEDRELLKKAFKEHLEDIQEKIERISPEEIEVLMSAYLGHYDLENIKTVLRAIERGRGFEDIEDMLEPVNQVSREELRGIIEAEDHIDALTDLKILDEGEEELREKDLQELERTIDRSYYTHVLEKAQRLLYSGQDLREVLELKVEIRNISLILRMKKQGYEREDIEDRLISVPKSAQSLEHTELLEADTYEEAVDILKAEDIGKYIENDSISDIERAMDRYRLEKGVSLLHKDPLSINPVIGYMIAKETEVANLRMIIKAREAGLGKQFVERNLVTAPV